MTHAAKIILGWLLYWCVARAMPVSWWACEDSPLWRALPLIGYYANHPHGVAWWRSP